MKKCINILKKQKINIISIQELNFSKGFGRTEAVNFKIGTRKRFHLTKVSFEESSNKKWEMIVVNGRKI